jgi:type VI secretion system protein ImpL
MKQIFFILLGFGGIWIGILFISKILLIRREQKFVQQVISQENAFHNNLGDCEKEKAKKLQEQWKEAIQALRKSRLKKFGNPLYVLPWYIVIGESASGKTTAIKSAGLSSPFDDLSRTSGISGIRNCDWWFFDQAIVLDTVGKFAIPVDEECAGDEWQKFLSLLSKFRKKEPINGLIITVPADKLIDPRMEILEDYGCNIRKLTDELMEVFGTKFPIYLMVTKCDLILGMTKFYSNFSEKNLDQAMGFLNQEMLMDAMALHERTVRIIGDRLKNLRLLIFQRSGLKIDPELLLFPEEFDRIKPGLDMFIKAAFQENLYRETPVLRGIFYTSGRQEGNPYSHFMNSFGLIQEKEIFSGTNKGFFLHDFFSKILPKDRGLFTSTQRTLEWGRLTRNSGLTTWIAISIALCGLLSFSFVKNLNTLKDAAIDFQPLLVLQGEIFTDLVTMDRLHQAILNIEEQNNKWWIPRFWLTESLGIEKKLKEKYCSRFNDVFLVSFDKHMSDRLSGFSAVTSDEEIGWYAAHLVRRINLLRAHLEGKDLEGLNKKPQPFYDSIVVSANRQFTPELRKQFHSLYLSNLAWRDDTSQLEQEINTLQSRLKHLLDFRPNEIHWIVAWINQEPTISDIFLHAFWKDRSSSETNYPIVSEQSPGKNEENSSIVRGAMVHRAFTSGGKVMIETFIQEMEEALPDPILLADRKAEFERWYKESYFNEWYEFGKKFPKNVELLKGKKEWQQMASIMASDNSPYFAVLDTMAEELAPFYDGFFGDKDLPAWVNLVFEFYIVGNHVENKSGEGIGASKNSGIFKRATKKVKATIKKLQQKNALGEYPGESELIRSRMVAEKAYMQYKNALQEITSIASSRQIAFQMTGEVFEENPAISISPFFIAQNAIQDMETAMTGLTAEQSMFWDLVKGPWDFLLEYATQESSCQIETLWTENVIEKAQEISDTNSMADLLLGRNGLVTKFIDGPAKPFVGRSSNKNYYTKEALGKKITFKNSFFNFLTQGALMVQHGRAETEQRIQSNYSVNIRGLPTDANPDAQIMPHATNLDVKCQNQAFTMVNLNYPVQKTINWSPDNCGDVVFSIEVDNLVLTRKYTGSDAFPRFLKDFSRGTGTFYPRDFPQHRSALERLNITQIRVNYQFRNYEPVLALLKKVEKRPEMPSLPKNIAPCWD